MSRIESQILKLFGDEIEDLTIHERDREIYLSSIRVKNKGNGVGTQILDMLKDYATKVGKPIILAAEADSGKKTALERFYAKNDIKKPGRSKNYALSRHTHIWKPTVIESKIVARLNSM